MKTAEIEIEDKVDKLLAVLDKDIEHIQQSISFLNELRSLVIKRDDAALSKLLERIQSETNNDKGHQSERQLIRKELASFFNCDCEEMTLSKLEANLPKEKQTLVTTKRTKLQTLINELKKEHISTALLLSECARFNRLLLKSVMGLGGSETVTYNSNGAATRHNDRVFVNLKL